MQEVCIDFGWANVPRDATTWENPISFAIAI